MKKVFFNNRFIAITDSANIPESVTQLNVCELHSFVELPNILHDFLYQSTESALYIIYKNEDDAFVAFCDMFDMIFTGGGLVRNSNKDVLMIYRFEHWDLPKGKQETGENIAETAVREVEEECGISDVKIIDFLTETYHCYTVNGQLTMKRTFWYEMFCDSKKLVPQAAEDIERAEFISLDKLQENINQSYASLRDVFVAAKLL
jgi:ADP-ribose pyrophosphatase